MNWNLFALMSFAFLMPLSKSLANVAMILLVLLTIWHYIKNKKDIDKRRINQYLVVEVKLFFLLLLCTIPFSAYVFGSVKEFYHYIGDAIVFFILIFCVGIKEQNFIKVNYIKEAFFVGMLLECIYLFGQTIFTKTIGLSGLYDNRIFLGFILEVAIPLSLSYAIVSLERKKKCWYGILCTVFVAALVITQARGPWLGTAFGIIMVIWLNRKHFNMRIGVAALLLTCCLAWGLAPLYSERSKTLIDMSHSTNLERMHIWEYTLNIIKDHPLAGVGLGQYQSAFKQYLPENDSLLRTSRGVYYAPHAHNAYLMIFAEAGIIGVVALTVLIVGIFKHVWRIKQKNNFDGLIHGYIGIMSAVVISSLVDNAFFSPYINKLLWLFLGGIFYMEAQSQNSYK